MVKWIRRNGEESNVEVLEVHGFTNIYDGGITIVWSGDIGFGEYELHFEDGKITAKSEGMDKSGDLRFLRALLEDMLNGIEVKE